MSPHTQNMLVDVGLPVQHSNVAYNCRVMFYNKKVILIRPKMAMCDDGNYRETRWFSAWTKTRQVEDFYLPRIVAAATGQHTVPFGDAVVSTRETCIGFEICEELRNPRSTHIDLSLAGVEIIVNGSGSYMQLRKAHVTSDLIRNASFKAGGLYLFSNLRGCDGQRVYWSGNSVIALNGDIIAHGTQFSLSDVEVTVATVDLEDIRSYRMAMRSRCTLGASAPNYPRIKLDIELSDHRESLNFAHPPSQLISYSAEEEIALGPACWLWDYLRRSGQGGFFLPLSGGVDSSSSACIVHSMSRLVVDAIKHGEAQVLEDVRRIISDPEYTPSSPAELCSRLLVTCYMGSENSSNEIRQRAAKLAKQIGSHHLETNIDVAVSAFLAVFKRLTGLNPKLKSQGGSHRENVAVQSVQARVRMVLSYLFAQLTLWVQNRPGSLLVLGSANVDEVLSGCMTKYDCSSADINPIGGISKIDLRLFLNYANEKFNVPILTEIIAAEPTAQLEPFKNGQLIQSDENGTRMTYKELSEFGRLRKQAACGPYSMFCKLVNSWGQECSPKEVSEKVKHFFQCYALNRHKMTILTPSIHMESYSPDGEFRL